MLGDGYGQHGQSEWTCKLAWTVVVKSLFEANRSYNSDRARNLEAIGLLLFRPSYGYQGLHGQKGQCAINLISQTFAENGISRLIRNTIVVAWS